MKITTQQWLNAGQPEIKIFLNNVEQHTCIEADDIAGYIIVTDSQFKGGALIERRLIGNVNIKCDEWVREKFTGPRLIIIESPYAGNIETNMRYARACLLDSLQRGEAPIASHLLYTQVLDDSVPAERQQGIDAGLAWRKVAQASVVYKDLGISEGMKYGIKAAIESGIPVEYRMLPDW